jgi:hypothetical protein
VSKQYELAYVALRACLGMLDWMLLTSLSGEEEDKCNRHDCHFGNDGNVSSYSRSGNMERRIAALITMRHSWGNDEGGDTLFPPLPADYYGSLPQTNSRQGQCDIIARAL